MLHLFREGLNDSHSFSSCCPRLQSELAKPGNIVASDSNGERRQLLSSTFGINVTKSNAEVASVSDVLFIAVKPQTLKQALENIKGRLRPNAVLVSMVAGATIPSLRELSGHSSIVRIMPNTPAVIGSLLFFSSY
jgi:pyrroline-5-carboxylate reductase